MNYLLLKQIHVSLALISIAGFILRWCWRMIRSSLAATRTVRIAPHVIDTLFLASAVALSITSADQPGAAWYSAKIIGLVIYILLGTVAMRSAPDIRRSVPAFLSALLVFAWIVTVAISKSPLGILQYPTL